MDEFGQESPQEKLEQLAKDDSQRFTVSKTFHINWDDYLFRFFKRLYKGDEKDE